MSVLRRMTLLALPLFVAACNAETKEVSPQAPQVAQDQTASIDKSVFQQRFAPLGLEVIDVTSADIAGMVEVQTSGGVLFASPDAKFFIAGTLYQMNDQGGYEDVLAKRQAPINAQKIASMSDNVIEYKADKEQFAVTVFTDITCGYCSRLHSQMQGYNDLGITVRYMAYPRQGGTGQVADQMAAIWCADDPKQAMNLAKTRRELPEQNDKFAQCQQIVKADYNLGRELGISGTPAIFMPNGEMVGGYLPPAQLIQRLQQTQ